MVTLTGPMDVADDAEERHVGWNETGGIRHQHRAATLVKSVTPLIDQSVGKIVAGVGSESRDSLQQIACEAAGTHLSQF